jgi:hypothetical protein
VVPVDLVERVDVAHGFVEGRVGFKARGLVDVDPGLVEEEVENFI